MANHGPVYGLDAELKAKRDASYDPQLENEAKTFISANSGVQINDFHEDLKSGVALCKMFNKFYPGKISKINTGKMPFIQMENIGNYLDACKAAGIPVTDLFQTVDLFEAKNLNQVVLHILTFKRFVEKK
eukprot:TRINITY_DN3684_c0_g1_i1.p2 TRINITY_DN3684_c0_g1~~TRINITY_DN3684_c0_g1_i1.p2  ORF type:complete len:130 (-),score=44.36 TRINITY_DN3684_c0_g1_i1:99-488(-)